MKFKPNQSLNYIESQRYTSKDVKEVKAVEKETLPSRAVVSRVARL